MVLIQFTSDKVSLSLPQLLQATGLDDRNEMERILQSLALGKDGTRILRKLEHTAEPGKKTKVLRTIDDRDTFIINTKFESKSRRIRITNIMMKETKEGGRMKERRRERGKEDYKETHMVECRSCR